MENLTNESMIFYRSFAKAIKRLPPEEQLSALWAILEYGLDGIEPTQDGIYMSIFDMAKPQIDSNRERRTNGKKGGRPKENESKTTGCENKKPMVTKEKTTGYESGKPNVNVNVNDNVNDNVNVNTSCPEAKIAPCSTQKIAASFVLNDGSMYNVTENDVETYQQLYPGIDCMQEIRNMVGWCDANPKNRKTRSGAKRFMNAWLSRAQNSAKKEPTRAQRTISKNQFHNFDQRNHDDNYYNALSEQMRRT